MAVDSSAGILPLIAERKRHVRWSRRIVTACGWALTGVALLLLTGMMLSILGVVLVKGVTALSPSLFTTVTQGTGGGLLNAIEGTAVLSVGAMVLAVPIGVAAGIYVSEYRRTNSASAIRFLSDVLVGVPSIVLGYFGYVTMVEGLGWNFSVAPPRSCWRCSACPTSAGPRSWRCEGCQTICARRPMRSAPMTGR